MSNTRGTYTYTAHTAQDVDINSIRDAQEQSRQQYERYERTNVLRTLDHGAGLYYRAVSYTHLTLPTKRIV